MLWQKCLDSGQQAEAMVIPQFKYKIKGQKII